MSEPRTPGRVSWTARNMALAGPAENPADALARLDAAWDYLTPGQQEAEEAGAAAVRPAPFLAACDLADQAIGLFLEYRDQHGHDEASARAHAALEVAEGAGVTDDEIGRARPASGIHDGCASTIAGLEKDRDVAREQLNATKLVLQETSRESSQRGAEIELLNTRVAELAEALGEAAGHVEPADQNSELAVGRWLGLARCYRPPKAGDDG